MGNKLLIIPRSPALENTNKKETENFTAKLTKQTAM